MSPSGDRADIAGLERNIDYRFGDADLAATALTHVSSATAGSGRARLPKKAPVEGQNRLSSYQRLEFLGDRVLGLAVSAMLFEAYPQAAEGELSQRLADLVRWESCAEVAQLWDVGSFLRLGAGELQSGGRGRPAILADVCEAIIGAVFLDGGFGAASNLVVRAWKPRMLAPRRALQDAKTMLQEWAQGRGGPAPVYRETERSGPDHAPRFTVSVSVMGYAAADGFGTSKRSAEQAAAEVFMSREWIGAARPAAVEGSDP